MKNIDLKAIRQTTGTGQAVEILSSKVTGTTTERTHPNRVPQNRVPKDSGITVRALLVVVLSITLVGVLRWAVDITNMNAKQVKKNVLEWQRHLNSSQSQFQNPDYVEREGTVQMGAHPHMGGLEIEPKRP